MIARTTTGIVTPIATFDPWERPPCIVDPVITVLVGDVDVGVVLEALVVDGLRRLGVSNCKISLSVDWYATKMGFALTTWFLKFPYTQLPLITPLLGVAPLVGEGTARALM
jgi:hypothetical protein